MFLLGALSLSQIVSAAPSGPNSQYSQAGAPWGLARLSHKQWTYSANGNTHFTDPNNFYYYNGVGGSVTVYMLDTGVDVSHPEFEGRARWGPNYVTSQDVDDNGHGTHLAGIAIGKEHGVARNASLVAVKILDSNREGSVDDFSKAVDWVIGNHNSTHGPAIINYSADGEISQFRADAITRATNNGIMVVNSAGNENTDACNDGPTNMGPNFTGLLTVGALNWTNTPASFSNAGTCLDIWAPGVDIQSSLPNGGYGYMSGTSNAAAFVSGLVAYLWGQNTTMTTGELMAAVRSANFGEINALGGGSPNAITYNYVA